MAKGVCPLRNEGLSPTGAVILEFRKRAESMYPAKIDEYLVGFPKRDMVERQGRGRRPRVHNRRPLLPRRRAGGDAQAAQGTQDAYLGQPRHFMDGQGRSRPCDRRREGAAARRVRKAWHRAREGTRRAPTPPPTAPRHQAWECDLRRGSPRPLRPGAPRRGVRGGVARRNAGLCSAGELHGRSRRHLQPRAHAQGRELRQEGRRH